jgi:ribosomal protein S1
VVSVGDEFNFVVLTVDRERRRVTLGLRQAIPNPLAVAQPTIAVGQVHRGTVTNIAAFGAFVDIGGGSGLIHHTHLSWSKARTAQATLKVGDQLDVIVLAMDKNNKRSLSLGRKELLPNPWEHLPTHLVVGKLVRGSVRESTKRGVLVTLDDELDGLIDLRGATNPAAAAAHPALRLNRGDDVEVEVLSIDPAKQLILLRLIRVF